MHTEDLVRIVSVLAHDVEKLDSLIRSHRPHLEQAAKGRDPDRELARQQWTKIRAHAVDVVNRAHDSLEKVKKRPSK